MRNRSKESGCKGPPPDDRYIRRNDFYQNYHEDYSISHRCNHKFSNLFMQMVHKKFAAFALFSATAFVMLIIYINFDKRFLVDRSTRTKLFPPNPEVPLPPSSVNLRRFRNAAINSDSEECSVIGRSVLQKNGSVIDATISAMFCLGLTSMQSMGLGGGFLMNLFIEKEGKAYTINARERAPILARNESYAAYTTTQNKMFTGPLSIAIPGEVLGYWELHKRYSVMKWKDLIEPTIKLCENGFVLSKHMADSFRLHTAIKTIPYYREIFLNAETGYSPKKPGSIVKPPQSLCSTYRLLAKNGGNDFYVGQLAELILSDLKDIGSIITKKDLELYRTHINESISIKLTDIETLHVTPPPSSGLIVSFALSILKKCKLTTEYENKAIIYHRIIEALKFAFAQRTRLSDPLFEDTQSIISYLTSVKTTDRLSKFVNDEQTYHSQYYNPKFSIKINFGTSHLSIIAPNGGAVSVTSSINYYFGSGLVGSRTGIIFNSGMDDFSYPHESNYFNLPPSPLNYIQPLKQAVTFMTPIIVTDNLGKVKIVIGAAGGAKIISSVVTSLVRVLWLGEDIKQAVDAPRLHHQLQPMVLEYEYGNEQSIINELEKRGHITERYSNRGSIINALYRNESGIYGIADYRKLGEVIGYYFNEKYLCVTGSRYIMRRNICTDFHIDLMDEKQNNF